MKTSRFISLILFCLILSSCNNSGIPENLEECYIEIDNLLSDSTKNLIPSMSEEEFKYDKHMGLGLHIRNNWGLWKGSVLTDYFHDLGVYHPDDMSGIIITSYYRHKTGKEIELERQIEHYNNYWLVIKKPTETELPAGVHDLSFMSYMHYDSELNDQGAVHVGRTENSDTIWLYDYFLGWATVSEAELDTITNNYENRENVLLKIYSQNK